MSQLWKRSMYWNDDDGDNDFRNNGDINDFHYETDNFIDGGNSMV